jgi:UDP-N-acetylmuramyl tripeptide synthase
VALHPSRLIALGVGKGTRALLRRSGRGGTSLPGLVAQHIDPRLAGELAQGISNGSLLVTGTNGKTTSTRMIAAALRGVGLLPITNREGSNMLRGVTTALLTEASWRGGLPDAGNRIGLFEVDEGHLPRVIAELAPRMILITNLCRDQLDRYFEVDFVASLWATALQRLSASTTLILNADDPLVAYLGESVPNPVLYYGLEDVRWGRPQLQHSADSRRCPRCMSDLEYSLSFYAHLGHYACVACGWHRPTPRLSAWHVEVGGLDGSTIKLQTPWGPQTLEVPLPGIFNAYNAIAAAATAYSLGVEPAVVRAAVGSVAGAFGRLESFTVDGRRVLLALVKNPSSFDQVTEVLLRKHNALRLLLALNDNTQDSRDVSWIWDAGFEQLRGRLEWVIASGHRAADLAVRLKYASVLDGLASNPGGLSIIPALRQAADQALRRTPPGEELTIITTYTAMWALRAAFVRRGHLRPFWQT